MTDAAPFGAGEQAVVVGATGAIGSAVVRRLTGRGLPVLAVARSKTDLDELAGSVDLVTVCPADIGSNDAIEAISSALTGPVRMAVFAAGLPVRGSADSIDPDALAAAAISSSAGCCGCCTRYATGSSPGRGS